MIHRKFHDVLEVVLGNALPVFIEHISSQKKKKIDFTATTKESHNVPQGGLP
jgi:hypothetical protein